MSVLLHYKLVSEDRLNIANKFHEKVLINYDQGNGVSVCDILIQLYKFAIVSKIGITVELTSIWRWQHYVTPHG